MYKHISANEALLMYLLSRAFDDHHVGCCRLTNGRQEQPGLQRVRSALLENKVPSRKRARPASGGDRESSPSTSTAQRSQDQAARRASGLEGGATSKPSRAVRSVLAHICSFLVFWGYQRV